MSVFEKTYDVIVVGGGHAGTALASGCGHATQLRCPYHGWTYDLDGRLRTAPRTAGLKGFRREDFGLVPISVSTWGPLLLLNPTGDLPAPDLEPLSSRLEAMDWSQLVYHSSRSYELACNWKVFVDNYLDGGYHVECLHPDLAAELDLANYTTDLYDRFSIQSSPSSGDATDRLAGDAIYAWVYPNLMINRYGPMMDINVVTPTGPGTCRVDFDWYFHQGCTERFKEESLVYSQQVQTEDIDICEAVQVGMGSSHFHPGPYAPRVEMGKHHFHGLLAADLQGDGDGP